MSGGKLERINLVSAKGLPTSYFGKTTGKRLDSKLLGEGCLAIPGMYAALQALKSEVEALGGDLFVTDIFRNWATQAKARKEYEADLRDPLKKNKKPFVSLPGGSFHTAGRAVDFDIHNLNFSNIFKQDWLEKLWELAIPLGFRPIIKLPNIEASEAWHFDYPGLWERAYEKLPYSEVAKCAILDCGKWDPKESPNKHSIMFVQSQLIRLGFWEVGSVDGLYGPQTKTTLEIFMKVRGHSYPFRLEDTIPLLKGA